MRKYSLILLGLLAHTATKAQTIKGFGHVESVASDSKYLYAADIGKNLTPDAKDSDGRITRFDENGTILDSNISKTPLHAPKGLAVYKSTLYLTDIDRLVVLDLNTGNLIKEINLQKEASFLNDIAVADEHTIYVSATDKNAIIRVDPITGIYSVLKTDKSIAGTNGLVLDAKTNRLYVNGMGSDNKPNGEIGYINLKTNRYSRIGNMEGLYDGLVLDTVHQKLYVSNWVAFDKKGKIICINLKDFSWKEIAEKEPFAGPADFILLNNRLVVPEMISGTIRLITP